MFAKTKSNSIVMHLFMCCLLDVSSGCSSRTPPLHFFLVGRSKKSHIEKLKSFNAPLLIGKLFLYWFFRFILQLYARDIQGKFASLLYIFVLLQLKPDRPKLALPNPSIAPKGWFRLKDPSCSRFPFHCSRRIRIIDNSWIRSRGNVSSLPSSA